LVIVHHHAPSIVLWNESTRSGNYLIVKLQGRGANRDAIGARLVANLGTRKVLRTIDGGGSYLSTHDPRAHFGLGQATHIDFLEVRWPGGRIETRSKVPGNATIDWVEGNQPQKLS